MKTLIFAVCLPLAASSSAFAAEDPPIIKPTKPINGVYFTYGWHNQVIELKDGKFRYWFNSDSKGSDVEALEGFYKVEGNKVILSHPQIFELTANWEVLSIDGVVTLWRRDALKSREEGKLDLYSQGKEEFLRSGGGSILVPSKQSAEKTWEPAAPMTELTEEQTEHHNTNKQNKSEQTTPTKLSD